MAPGPIRTKRRSSDDPKPYSRDPLAIGDDDEETLQLPTNITPQQIKAWQEIADKMNARFGGRKTWQDCAKRWNLMRQKATDKMADHMKTTKDQESSPSPGTTTTTTTAGGGGGVVVRLRNGRNLDNVDRAVVNAGGKNNNNNNNNNNTTHPQNLDHSYSQQRQTGSNGRDRDLTKATSRDSSSFVSPPSELSEDSQDLKTADQIKEEEEDDDDDDDYNDDWDIEIKEEVVDEMDELTETNTATATATAATAAATATKKANEGLVRNATHQGQTHRHSELVPALVECIKNVNNLAKLMSSALENLQKLQEKF